MRSAVHITRILVVRNAYEILAEKPEEKGLLVRSRRRWEDNVKVDLKETRYEDVVRIRLGQDRD
jgi:hypothetical protein